MFGWPSRETPESEPSQETPEGLPHSGREGPYMDVWPCTFRQVLCLHVLSCLYVSSIRLSATLGMVLAFGFNDSNGPPGTRGLRLIRNA